MIDARSVGKSVSGPEGTLHILADIDLSVAAGDSIGDRRRFGLGKTTLLGLLAGLDLPSHGHISLAASAWMRWMKNNAPRCAREVGFVFQSFHLLPSLTAEENVALPLELAGREDPARVREVLQAVGLAARARHYPRQLSGGEQQRVRSRARAFVGRPRILFADEPTGSLDHATGRQISDLLFALNAGSGTTLVLVTHDPHLAQRCGHVYRIDEGAPAAAARRGRMKPWRQPRAPRGGNSLPATCSPSSPPWCWGWR